MYCFPGRAEVANSIGSNQFIVDNNLPDFNMLSIVSPHAGKH